MEQQQCTPNIHILSILLLISTSLFFPSSSLSLSLSQDKRNMFCSKDGECEAGFTCQTCPISGNSRPRCTLIQPILPTSLVKGLPFNKYSWLTTHNAFANKGSTKSGTGGFLLAPTNQEDTVTSQLHNGVRGLMLDMYDFENDIWLCHSFGGKCFNFTAFQPAINVLKEIQEFLQSNPTEIVTIFIEDYVTTPMGLTKLFNNAGLSKFMFPLSRMPKNGADWPTVDDMVRKNQRLLVFSSVKSKESSEGIAYNWNYVIENQYGDDGMKDGSCPNRAESPAMNTATISLILENYFPDNPNSTKTCLDNSAPLIKMMNTCFQQDGKRWPNYIAVDYYQRSDGGGASEAVNIANGHLTCGCDNIAYCKKNGKFGECDVPVLAPPPPATLSTTTTAANESPMQSNSVDKRGRETFQCWLYGSLFMSIMLSVL